MAETSNGSVGGSVAQKGADLSTEGAALLLGCSLAQIWFKVAQLNAA